MKKILAEIVRIMFSSLSVILKSMIKIACFTNLGNQEEVPIEE